MLKRSDGGEIHTVNLGRLPSKGVECQNIGVENDYFSSLSLRSADEKCFLVQYTS